jgi:hypothetical protein
VLLPLLLQLAWVPFELEEVARAAAPHVLAADWQAAGDNEMLLLQVRQSTQCSRVYALNAVVSLLLRMLDIHAMQLRRMVAD